MMITFNGVDMEHTFITTILSLADNEFYRAGRYSTPVSIVLFGNITNNTFITIEKNIRQTDTVQQLDSTTIVVILSHSDHNQSIMFSEKIKRLVSDISPIYYVSREFKCQNKITFLTHLITDFLHYEH